MTTTFYRQNTAHSKAAYSPKSNVTSLDLRRKKTRPTAQIPQTNVRHAHNFLHLNSALISLVMMLSLLGLLMILSASSAKAVSMGRSPWTFFIRQSLWLSLGIGVFIAVSRFDYHRYRRWSGVGFLVCFGLLLSVYVPGVGINVNGSRRWVGIGSVFAIQPSELMKCMMILFAADILTRRARTIADSKKYLKHTILTAGAVALCIVMENLGTTLVFTGAILTMLFVNRIAMKWILGLTGFAAFAAFVFARIRPYRWRRIMAFRDPWSDPAHNGYQPIQSRVGLVEGGLNGTGIWQGRAKWGYLPEAHTDFIFTVIGEELGFIGAILVMLCFLALFVVGVLIAMNARDRYGALIATGITAWLLLQTGLNLSADVGLLPVTGVPLPFVSYGGSSLLISFAAIGILANIAKYSKQKQVHVVSSTIS